MEYFQDEDTCRQHFTAIRFRNGEYCPHCGHTKIYTFSNGKRYRCGSCKQDFTIKTGTVFGESKLPIKKWFIAIYLLSTTSKGISSVQLAKHVGVTQKTGWFMDHRIRKAMKQNGGQLFGRVEADETFIGGRATNMHAKKRAEKDIRPGGWDKATVFGARSRAGEVKAKVIPSVHSIHLHKAVKETVAPGSTLYTDKWVGYHGLVEYAREMVDHSAKQYVNGDCHTNGIESFWAIFKRGFHGVYHQMSRKHLQRYVNEFLFRANRKTDDSQDMFHSVVTNISESSKLPYKELTA